MDRAPLAVGAAGGSFASLVLRLLSDNWYFGPTPAGPLYNPIFDCVCPQENRSFWAVHYPSLVLGILLGFFLWPLLEALVLFRQLVELWIRRQLAVLSRQPEAWLYRVLS